VLILGSDAPVTFELSPDGIKYNRSSEGELTIGAAGSPAKLMLNGARVKNFTYDKERKLVIMKVPAGEGNIILQ
jgi:hypothetical protein